MSGYLQRLVSSARDPGSAIHPLVGSLYSGPTSESMPAPMEEEIVVKSPIAQAQPSTADPAAATPERSEPDRVESRRQSAERVFAPLIEETTVQPPAMVARSPVPTTSADTEPRRRGSGPSPARGLAPQHAPPQVLSSVRSGLPATRQSVHTAESRPPGSGPAAQVQRSPKLTLQPHTAPAPKSAREPDEVQIHIGRIEVIATPPPASRPLSKPAAKSPSLTEYLKRGRRR